MGCTILFPVATLMTALNVNYGSECLLVFKLSLLSRQPRRPAWDTPFPCQIQDNSAFQRTVGNSSYEHLAVAPHGNLPLCVDC